MFNRLQDAKFENRDSEKARTVEPIPLRDRLLVIGGIVIGVAAIHVAGLVDDIISNEMPPKSAEASVTLDYLQEDLDNKQELAVELPLLAAGVTTYIGYMVTSKKPENK